MADFESIIKNHVDGEGHIPAEAIGKLAKAISTAVGNEFVEKSRYKNKLEEIEQLKGEKQTAEDSLTTAEKWKTKYEGIKSEFEQYKKDQSAKETRGEKEKVARALMKEVGISDKRIDSVLKVYDVDRIELDEKGEAKNADKLKDALKSDWSDFIVTTETKGAQTSNPPTNSAGKTNKTKEEIYAIKDPAARQKAILENHELFGF